MDPSSIALLEDQRQLYSYMYPCTYYGSNIVEENNLLVLGTV